MDVAVEMIRRRMTGRTSSHRLSAVTAKGITEDWPTSTRNNANLDVKEAALPTTTISKPRLTREDLLPSASRKPHPALRRHVVVSAVVFPIVICEIAPA